MAPKNKGKAKIEMSKPDLPPFLQRMKEQIVANEDADRREQSEKKRKQREATKTNRDNEDDDPTIVKLNEEDLTEEEYKRMKLDLETQYKLDDKDGGRFGKSKPDDLNIDDLINVRQDGQRSEPGQSSSSGINKSAASAKSSAFTKDYQRSRESAKKKSVIKKLSYETSSESESNSND